MFNVFISKLEPKTSYTVLEPPNWVVSMQYGWFKWIFKNKVDKEGNVVCNKAKLLVKGYCWKEGISYGETIDPLARFEVVRFFLAYEACKGFDVDQMDVKCAFLNDVLEETV